ncbi:hypothetical protein J3R82DRAFT_11489 [Butyriboletus roseoflavus]|nr:hypothetical protein J3R82DRAFT_11489 [Butyriboletus roseoflavus]
MPASKQGHHAVLGLTSDASDDAIKAAYKKLALQWHPDRHLVDKEAAAQMFIEVNKAYHALMDGKESTHSSSTETSSTTSAPSANPTHSDTHTKSTQASSRPPSASSNSSKRSSPKSSKSPSSAPGDGHSKNTSKSGTHSRTPPSPSSSSHASSSDDLKPSSHPRPAKPSPDGKQSSSDRMRSGRTFSKSHDHLGDPPCSAAPKTATPASTYSRSSEGFTGSVRSKSSEKTTRSSPASTEPKHDSRSSRTGTSKSRTSLKPVIPPPSGRLHKSPKTGFADEFVHKLSGTTKGKKEPPHTLPHDEDATPYDSPLRAINTPRGASKEWIFPLPLTLDEMYHGTSYRFLVTRELLSHRTEQVEISVAIPPGMRSGTRIVCPRTGHQRKDGTLQDVVFLVEEVPEERFSRVKDDLFLDVCIPWADPLADQGGEICIQGIDGKEITFALPYPIYDEATEGQVLVKGAGMPIREGRKTIGRGDMIIRWRVVFTHQSKWQTLKKAFHLDV